MLVDRVGSFRGLPLEWAVTKSSGGFLQFEVRASALECYNEEAGVWADWSEYGQEITAYLMLQSGQGKKDPLDLAQVMKVFGWDGKSYLQLNNGDYSEIKFQFRVAENLYEGNVTLQVEWIDEYDAEPGRKIKRLSEAELKALDKKFGRAVPATKKAVPKAPAKKSPKAPVKKAKKSAPPAKDLLTGCTKEQAWDYLNENPELWDEDVTEDKVAEMWLDAIDTVAGATAEEAKITEQQWFTIRETVAEKVFKF